MRGIDPLGDPNLLGIRYHPYRNVPAPGLAYERIAIPCDWCGDHFLVWPSESDRRFCSRAHFRAWQHDPKRLAAHFWARVAVGGPDECWFWSGAPRPDGYGEVTLFARRHLAHRAAFLFTHGCLPAVGCHTCESRYPVGDMTYRLCVNPAHIEDGSMALNAAHRMANGRQARGERNGVTRLSDAQIAAIQDAPGPQVALARHYGVSHSTVSRIKSGKQRRA